MSDCECGAHWMQKCSWWCGLNLTANEIFERENPGIVRLEKIEKELCDIKEMLAIKIKENKND